MTTPTTTTTTTGTDVRGRFVWHELMTTDPEGAQNFYRSITGWETAPFEGAETPYTMWMNGQAPVGGVMQLPEDLRSRQVPPHWLTYVGTNDVDATAQQAKQLGGSIMVPPQDIPNVGRFAILADPQGAVFAIYKSSQEIPSSEDVPQVGEFSWHELTANDHVKAFDFYSKLFGWVKTDAMDMGPMGIYQMYGRSGGRPEGGMYNRGGDWPAPPNWLPYIKVSDINKAADAVKRGGGNIINGPMEVPGGDWILVGKDPQGGVFALHAAKQG
jgi:predicted enzyme related to lactoylglutathione lyase